VERESNLLAPFDRLGCRGVVVYRLVAAEALSPPRPGPVLHATLIAPHIRQVIEVAASRNSYGQKCISTYVEMDVRL
jgi:hypothetical protein